MRVKYRRITAIVLGTCAFVALTGCGNATTDTASPLTTAAEHDGEHVAPRSVPEGMGSGESDGVFPRTVSHFQGETTIEARPERVAVISTGQADGLLSLGVVPIASTRGDGADLVPAYLTEAYPEQSEAIAGIADVGDRFEPDYEALAALHPDLILLNVSGKDSETMYGLLSAIAPTVATEGTGVNWKQDYLLVADAVGRTEQAQAVLDEFHADAEQLGHSLPSAPTVSFTRQNADRLRVFGVPSFTGSIAEDIGVARPGTQTFDKTSRDISNEELDLADADWIFYGVQGETNTLSSAPLWGDLEAVKAGHAVRVDDDVFYLNTGPTAARLVLEDLESNLG